MTVIGSILLRERGHRAEVPVTQKGTQSKYLAMCWCQGATKQSVVLVQDWGKVGVVWYVSSPETETWFWQQLTFPALCQQVVLSGADPGFTVKQDAYVMDLLVCVNPSFNEINTGMEQSQVCWSLKRSFTSHRECTLWVLYWAQRHSVPLLFN